MKLNVDGIKQNSFWQDNGILLPDYDVESIKEKAVKAPRWVHFGIGNIFRGFIGGIADGLLEEGYLDRGLTCVETFDYEVVDRIYVPYDNLALSVILNSDGTREKKVLGSLAEVLKADYTDQQQWSRLKEVFCSKDLQIVSFTITEKGYALRNAAGAFTGYVQKDIEAGPDGCTGAMGIVTAMLYERFLNGAVPVALVSMDNCSRNGSFLRDSILTVASEWQQRGFVGKSFLTYLKDETKVAFPWTMIDKITPRPDTAIAEELEKLGLEKMQPVITQKRTYIAPFINAEGPQYLVIEDTFPNGRPALEHGKGVYMADRDTVNRSERMKVTACLNPVHSALGPLQVVLGIDLFAEGLKDPVLLKMGCQVAYDEGMKVIEDPGIISPQAFTDELFEDRFPNVYLGDTNLRLSTDVSQGVGVRFGETIKSYVAKFGTAESLVAIPLGIVSWLRYMLAVDDQGNAFELAPDPMNQYFTDQFRTIKWDDPSSLTDQLRPVLSNENIFFTDLYQAGIGEKMEEMFREMLAGKGAARATIEKYIR